MSSPALRPSRRAFSLIEMMLVMGMLAIIVVALLAMFNQTQKAFRASVTQTDVLEGGRAITDMLAHDLAGIVPAYRADVTNFFAEIPGTNFFVQWLPGGTVSGRTNVLENVFFLTRENQKWIGQGYCFTNNSGGIGSLFQFMGEVNVSQNPGLLFSNFVLQTTLQTTNLHRLLEGVVQFRVRAFDRNGSYLSLLDPNQFVTNNIQVFTNSPATSGLISEVRQYVFKSNAVPAYVEFELGILEKRTYERYLALEAGSWAAANFLTNQIGQVHLFRQRVPVRMVDPSVYR